MADSPLDEDDPLTSCELHGCGCRVVTFRSGKIERTPCLPCNMRYAADHLRRAGEQVADALEEIRELKGRLDEHGIF